MARDQDFCGATKQLALLRQRFVCGSCGTKIPQLGAAGRAEHRFGEIAHAHHVRSVKEGGQNGLDNCVILCQSCHYTAHEGGNYRGGTVIGTTADFPHGGFSRVAVRGR